MARSTIQNGRSFVSSSTKRIDRLAILLGVGFLVYPRTSCRQTNGRCRDSSKERNNRRCEFELICCADHGAEEQWAEMRLEIEIQSDDLTSVCLTEVRARWRCFLRFASHRSTSAVDSICAGETFKGFLLHVSRVSIIVAIKPCFAFHPTRSSISHRRMSLSFYCSVHDGLDRRV